MCLGRTKPMPTKIPTYGWKVFRKMGGKYYPECRGVLFKKGYETAHWIKKVGPKRIKYSFKKSYRSGFHVFRTRENARQWNNFGKIVKVKIRKVHTYGEQWFFDVFVCDEMLIPQKLKRRP